jgi:hypothetical protein
MSTRCQTPVRVWTCFAYRVLIIWRLDPIDIAALDENPAAAKDVKVDTELEALASNKILTLISSRSSVDGGSRKVLPFGYIRYIGYADLPQVSILLPMYHILPCGHHQRIS